MSNDEFQVECEEYQGGSTAILQIFKTQLQDAGTYTLRGENRNGSDKVDLDLVVLDTSHDIECEMLKNANLECRCSQSFRSNIISKILEKYNILPGPLSSVLNSR